MFFSHPSPLPNNTIWHLIGLTNNLGRQSLVNSHTTWLHLIAPKFSTHRRKGRILCHLLFYHHYFKVKAWVSNQIKSNQNYTIKDPLSLFIWQKSSRTNMRLDRKPTINVATIINRAATTLPPSPRIMTY